MLQTPSRRTADSYPIPLSLVLLATMAAAGCSDPAPQDRADAGTPDALDPPVDASGPDATNPDASNPDAGPPGTIDPALSIPGGDVDILFVVDNSGSMLEEQQMLGTAFQSFLPALEAAYGRRPDLHIGVVSTDMGVGPWVGTGCSAAGDGGEFLGNPACGMNGAFIQDFDIGETARASNYTGALDDVLSCAVQLGNTGCGFEQTLESMRRALDGSNPNNAVFLRDDAMLLVVILTDEDDCSVHDTDMFDTTQMDVDDPLGPLSSYRCFEFGVQCDPDTPRIPGLRSNCTTRDPSPYMGGIQEYVSFLESLKPPGQVYVVSIQGNSTPVSVTTNPEQGNIPVLAPSCVSAIGEAAPGVRLSEFAASFPTRNEVHSICSPLDPVMQQLGTTIGNYVP